MGQRKITVIDNYDSFVYNLVRYLEEELHCEIHVMRNDSIDYEILDQSERILLSPGPGIPSEAGELMNVIQKYVNSKKILGICLGHQAIGEHFQMKLKQSPEIMHGKVSKINLDNNNQLFNGLPSEIEVGRYHSWEFEQSSESQMKVIAKTDKGEIMAIQHETLPIYGMQYHPESILTPTGRKQIQNFLKL